MSLLTSSALGPEATGVLACAVSEIAEQCFFAEAVPERTRTAIAGEAADWLTATVQFDEPGCEGALRCALPIGLARTLFDAFNGRDPIDPEPSTEDVLDLVGELSNMICGAWLTRLVNHQSFLLRRPIVGPLFDRSRLDETPTGASRVTMRVNELPMVIDVDVRGTVARRA
jgi:hypothetical protein